MSLNLEAMRERMDRFGVVPLWDGSAWILRASVDARELLGAGRASLNRPMGSDLGVEKVPYFDRSYRRWRLASRPAVAALMKQGHASLEPARTPTDFEAYAKAQTEQLQRS